DDGVIELIVEVVETNQIRCRITRGGNLADRKGVNLPGTFLGMPAMTAENRADLVFAVENSVDYIAASFVRGRDDVREIRQVLAATQMLDSMRSSPLPTRAEVSDVANAILDGTSAVMLSNETAAGKYPVEAVRTMASLALEAEKGLREYGHLQQVAPARTHEV